MSGNSVAIDIGGTALKIGLFSADGVMRAFSEQPTQAHKGVDALLDMLCRIVSEFEHVERVGISTAGQVDPKDGSIAFATRSIPGYSGVALRQILERRLDVPVAVDNDVNCAAIGEAHYGAGQKLDNFLCAAYGTGIGGAIVIDRKIYRGARGFSGAIGHMITHADGLPCVCGKNGCYEMYASTNALVRRVTHISGKSMNGRDIFAEFDNAAIRTEIDGWIDEIVYGLTSLAHIFNPQCFILGGGIMNEAYVIDSIDGKLKDSVLQNYHPIAVRHAQLGNKAGIMGAFFNANKMIHGGRWTT